MWTSEFPGVATQFQNIQNILSFIKYGYLKKKPFNVKRYLFSKLNSNCFLFHDTTRNSALLEIKKAVRFEVEWMAKDCELGLADSHIFYPSDLACCNEPSYLIGFNTTGFNCSICCTIPKDLFHDTYALVEEALDRMAGSGLSRQYLDYMGTNPIILGEWRPSARADSSNFPEGDIRYSNVDRYGGVSTNLSKSGSDSVNRQFLLRNIWITLTSVPDHNHGHNHSYNVAGIASMRRRVVLTNVHSCNNVYDTSSYQLVCFEKCNTDEVVLLLNLMELSSRVGIEPPHQAVGESVGNNENDRNGSDSDNGSSTAPSCGNASSDTGDGSGAGGDVNRVLIPQSQPRSALLAPLKSVPLPALQPQSCRTTPPAKNVSLSTAASAAAKGSIDGKGAGSRLTLLQLTQLQQLLAHELEFCLNATLLVGAQQAGVTTAPLPQSVPGDVVENIANNADTTICNNHNSQSGNSSKIGDEGDKFLLSVLERIVRFGYHTCTICCLPAGGISACLRSTRLSVFSVALSNALFMLQESSFVVCYICFRVKEFSRYYSLRCNSADQTANMMRSFSQTNRNYSGNSSSNRSSPVRADACAADEQLLFTRLRQRYDTWAFVTNIWVDLFLGIVFSLLISRHYPEILGHAHYACDVAQSHLIMGTVEWFNQSPFGIKLNAVATRYISDLIMTCFVEFERVYVASLGLDTTLRLIIRGVQMFGAVGGLSGQIMLLIDAVRLSALHLKVIALSLGIITSVAMRTLTTLFLFFQGKKRNPLRGGRVDSALEQDSEQLLIGTIVFAITVFITPTFLTFYAFFGLLQLSVQVLIALLWHVSMFLVHCPWFLLYQRLKNPNRVVNGHKLMFSYSYADSCSDGSESDSRVWGEQLYMRYPSMAYRDIFQLLWGYFEHVYYCAFTASQSRSSSVRNWITNFGGQALYQLVGFDYQLLNNMCKGVTVGSGIGDSVAGVGRSGIASGNTTAANSSLSNSMLHAKVLNTSLWTRWTNSVERRITRRQLGMLQLQLSCVLTQFVCLSCAVCAIVYYAVVYCDEGSAFSLIEWLGRAQEQV